MLSPKELAQRAAAIALDNKGVDVVVLSLKGVSDMTDFFVIASGTSDTHVRALGEHIQAGLKQEGTSAHHVEGVQQGRGPRVERIRVQAHRRVGVHLVGRAPGRVPDLLRRAPPHLRGVRHTPRAGVEHVPHAAQAAPLPRVRGQVLADEWFGRLA